MYGCPLRRSKKGTRQGKAKRRTRAQWDERIRSHIREKSQKKLAELVWTLVGRFSELLEKFQERIALAQGDVKRLVNQARHDLYELTAEIGWRNHWEDEE